jgi:signal transduction histidine kinase
MTALSRWRGSIDALLAVALASGTQIEVWTGLSVGGNRWIVAGIGLMAALSLAWRRRAPMAVLVVTVGAIVALPAVGVVTSTMLTPPIVALVGTASAGYHARRPVLALVVALVLSVSSLPVAGTFPVDFVFVAFLFTAAWSAGRAIRVRQAYADLLQLRAAQLEREAELRAAVAVAEERMHIARELHDMVAHSMSVVLLHTGGARRLLRADQRHLQEALLAAEGCGREALQQMYRLLAVLRTGDGAEPASPQPGLGDVAELLDPVRAAGLAAHLDRRGTVRELPPGLELAAYRIMQEAVTNVVKHATATRIDCTIDYGDDTVRLDIVDNGSPHRTASPQVSTGNGLVGIRERVAFYGGTVQTGPTPRQGYRVTARLPIPRQPT